MILQLATYGLWWLAFVAIAYHAARLGGFWGIVAGHVLIAFLIAVIDLGWVRTEMSRSNWAGAPDQDIIFAIGVLLRVILANTILLPISIAAWFSGAKSDTNIRAAGQN